MKRAAEPTEDVFKKVLSFAQARAEQVVASGQEQRPILFFVRLDPKRQEGFQASGAVQVPNEQRGDLRIVPTIVASALSMRLVDIAVLVAEAWIHNSETLAEAERIQREGMPHKQSAVVVHLYAREVEYVVPNPIEEPHDGGTRRMTWGELKQATYKRGPTMLYPDQEPPPDSSVH